MPNPAPTAAPPVQPTPAQPVIVLDRFAHARANLAALLEGRLLVSELAPLELQDVLDLARNLRGNRPDTRTPSQQCVDDEVRRNGGRPSRLAWEVIALKCREIGEGYAR
ncbi:MAG: hypothetical protein V2I39_13985 [Erythrobacter sp.]|nr:hypothetical protein [Erythrobacter sp.]